MWFPWKKVKHKGPKQLSRPPPRCLFYRCNRLYCHGRNYCSQQAAGERGRKQRGSCDCTQRKILAQREKKKQQLARCMLRPRSCSGANSASHSSGAQKGSLGTHYTVIEHSVKTKGWLESPSELREGLRFLQCLTSC